MEGKPDELSSVGVAVRVRPLNKTEKEMNSPVCMIVDSKEHKIITSKDKSFTFDQVFDMSAKQVDIFESSTKDLVLSLFAGYNATVLAYGQTGSGKTYTMGSAQVSDIKEEEIGIIPRVISMLFQEIEKRKNSTEFLVKASFLEIYNEEIKDLLDPKSTTDKSITIKEIKGNIVCLGLHEEKVQNYEELLSCLEKGTVRRIVQKTKMNEFSSRSHAIFSIVVEQTSIDPQPEVTEGQEYIMAKFHFVDLAGSERVKRTEAEGDVLRQGISINLGLLSLGKVISALTEDSHKKGHVPYRDSKLTRILQDSLGGNARTYMIACISPAEVNEEETLSTLRYASRARNIKNKPVVNRDPQSALIASLRDEVTHLKLEIKAYQKVLNNPASEDLKASFEALKKTFGSEGEDEELKTTSLKLQNTEWKLSQVTSELEEQKQTNINFTLELLQVQRERDLMKIKNEAYLKLLQQHNIDFAVEDENCVKLVDEYQTAIQSLRKVDEQKDRLIFELQGLKTKLEKELARETKLLQKKSEELERMRHSREDLNLEEELLRNVEDYGRTFAETILAKISKPVEEVQEEAEIEDAESDIKEQQEELATVERKIKEHEDIKKNIEEAFRDLQPQFLEEMSHQYYKKIEELKQEKTSLEKERDLALEKMKGSSVSEKHEVSERFKAKIQALEDRLKENKRKDKELGEMQKLVETQKKQLFKLDDEIRRAKTEKIRLQKKIKEENEEAKKWKTEKQKEILKFKRNGMIKDKEIASLKSENRKKELIARKKTEEVAALQKRQKSVQLIKKKSLSVNLDVLKQWVEEYTVACVDEREITQSLNDEIQERENIEKEIQEITSYKAKLEIALDRHELMMAEDEPSIDKNELYTKILALKEEITEIQDRAEILDNKIPRKNNLIIGYSTALSNSKVEEIRSKALTLNSVEDSQVLVSILFDEILNKALQTKQSEKAIRELQIEIENKQEIIDQAYKETEVVIKNYEKEINLMKEEFQAQKLALQEEIFTLKGQEDDFALKKSVSETLDKSETLKTKTEETKSRHSIVPLNKARESLKKRRLEDEKTKKTLNSSRISNSRLEDDSIRSTPSKHRTFSESDPTKFLQKWKLTGNVDTGKGIIYSMLAQENILYTALTGCIKIWNLDTLSKISEFSTQNNTAKALAFCPENNFCIGGCGNTVKVWETVSLHSIGQLQVEMEEVRGLKFQNNLLYCCGKSSENFPALCIWDLRQCQTPVFQSELGQEISSMTVSQDSIFYSRKSNHICRNFTNNEEALIYPSPHLASVTGLAVYGETLVSSSRDKSLKQFDSSGNCISSLTGFHTDWINCLEVDYQQRQVYSGGKDGKIKVWKGGEGEAAKLVGDLPSFNFSVLSISSLHSQEVGIVSAGNDKTFKIWKMTEDCDF
jgi:kinesin family protein 4/21/27